MKTWRQYAKAVYRDLRAEYPDASAEEARMCVEHYRAEWRQSVEDAARDGMIFAARFLNTLHRDHRRQLARIYPDSIPPGYVFPECRSGIDRRLLHRREFADVAVCPEPDG